MKLTRLLTRIATLGAGLAAGAYGLQAMAAKALRDVPRMDPDDLKLRLEDPSLTIFDVRAPHDWNNSETRIKGAIRREGDAVAEWAAELDKNGSYVLYCA